MPSEKWGETPCAFVELAEGQQATADDLIAFARENMAKFKAPRFVAFEELPKTSTGKIQKFQLRERAKVIAGGE
jgi:fatty-acyl-CoA synthase